ncbi:MAG: nucleotidyltransferase domain-containing protein [Anaerolineae bacterium]|jgi:predicted nucleotidyltransferase|nr:nucleotidyltransferase domain-containing protein [Anaerolineae bacterium]
MAKLKTRSVAARRPIPRSTIDQTVNAIVEQFRPERVILFGSYAYGQPQPESDVDLLVIMDTSLKEVEQAVQICQAVAPRYGLDLIVRTPANLRRRLALGDLFLREVVGKGEVVYERTDG